MKISLTCAINATSTESVLYSSSQVSHIDIHLPSSHGWMLWYFTSLD